MSDKYENTVKDELKTLPRFEIAKKLLLQIVNSGERNFYKIKAQINETLEREGKRIIDDDEYLVMVIESVGMAI